jgi:hypothetical protein
MKVVIADFSFSFIVGRVKSLSFGYDPNFRYRGLPGSQGSTAVVATGPFAFCATSFSAAVGWTLKHRCCFTVGLCVSANPM